MNISRFDDLKYFSSSLTFFFVKYKPADVREQSMGVFKRNLKRRKEIIKRFMKFIENINGVDIAAIKYLGSSLF